MSGKELKWNDKGANVYRSSMAPVVCSAIFIVGRDPFSPVPSSYPNRRKKQYNTHEQDVLLDTSSVVWYSHLISPE